ncbi:MAG: ketoacyl-ACP synthase III, partial [Pyrinomonadaceae bacterium]|nr:ketoacyl-ACP synthase III [Phycisphaerales bacterium]
ERRVIDPAKGECTSVLCTEALRRALASAKMEASELDLIIVATVTGEMTCPSTACRVAGMIGAGHAPAFDISAACSGFVFSLNTAHEMVRGGAYRSVAVIGCDVLSPLVNYSDAGRGTSILFGDAAGAVILRSTDDRGKGIVAQVMHSDGTRWQDLYLPCAQRDIPAGADRAMVRPKCLQMNGREVYKFAVTTFCDLIEETLKKAGITADSVDHYVCHQSNARILESAREKFGIPHEKMYVNIDRVGNSSAGSVPLCFDELKQQGRINEGDVAMLVAFGGGLTWASSLWQL